ncbi:FAD-binding oxidoreductase [Paenalcaligenes sp.]|uniref:FAD-binding oxidoreductase n=1 Tax=Paenalcaligenes sp. TaxID=1966342 RepID=UPI002630AA24|nr:FAD-binding oxidoreductase [Paenalcaligenes sp.]
MALAQITQIVGADHVWTGQLMQPFLTDWRGRYQGDALAVVRPASTAEVAAVVRCCAQHRLAIVPQGGNTSLCGAATPSQQPAIILSLQRLNRIRSIDVDNDTMVVEAGCILQTVQEAALAENRLFPLRLAAEGSCTIGGNLATNAGGTQVLRYGNTRDLVLGLEVVTPSGDIWHGLHGLRKDNSGYDLRHLFIGSEGTLGIITAATLKLYPVPVAQYTALIALHSVSAAVQLLNHCRQGFAASLTGFELMAHNCLEAVVQCFPEQRIGFTGASAQAPWYVLLELSDYESESHARERLEHILGQALEQHIALDVIMAENLTQSQALWHLRESIPLAEKVLGKSIKHDIGVPTSQVAAFVEETNALIQQAYPGVEHVIFGHLGDGNLHYNVAKGSAYSEAELLALEQQVYRIVFDQLAKYQGTISAEHGVGQLKRDWLPQYKDPVALQLMHQIKQALDPLNIMNPGKVLSQQEK